MLLGLSLSAVGGGRESVAKMLELTERRNGVNYLTCYFQL